MNIAGNQGSSSEALDTHNVETSQANTHSKSTMDMPAMQAIRIDCKGKQLKRGVGSECQEAGAHNSSLRGIVKGILPPISSQNTKTTAVVISHVFPFWCLAAQGLEVIIKEVILLDSKWSWLVNTLFPNTKVTLISEMLNKRENNTSVDLILVNSVPFTEVLGILNKYSHKNILFDSRLRVHLTNRKNLQYLHHQKSRQLNDLGGKSHPVVRRVHP